MDRLLKRFFTPAALSSFGMKGLIALVFIFGAGESALAREGGGSPEERKETVEPKKKKKKKKKRSDRLEVPIPVNHNAGGIKVPDYDADGQLRMMFQIGSAQRVNEDELEMSNVKIETFDDAGQAESEISMSKASLHLVTREIISEEPVTIRRPGFEIIGSKLIFQAKERKGIFNAPVKVLIYNRDYLEETEKKEGSKDAEDQSVE